MKNWQKQNEETSIQTKPAWSKCGRSWLRELPCWWTSGKVEDTFGVKEPWENVHKGAHDSRHSKTHSVQQCKRIQGEMKGHQASEQFKVRLFKISPIGGRVD